MSGKHRKVWPKRTVVTLDYRFFHTVPIPKLTKKQLAELEQCWQDEKDFPKMRGVLDGWERR